MKINYQKQLDTLLETLDLNNPPRLLLHSCCGPCSTYVLKYLANYFQISVFFYNPNIQPESEYCLRLEAQRNVLTALPLPNKVTLIEGDYDPQSFFRIAKGLEDEPERGARCAKCIEQRIEKTAAYAAENGFDYFCTTLSVSPHKDAELLHQLSLKYAEKYGVPALPAVFKKKNGYLESTRLSKELDLYRQNYCGCIFSKQKGDD